MPVPQTNHEESPENGRILESTEYEARQQETKRQALNRIQKLENLIEQLRQRLTEIREELQHNLKPTVDQNTAGDAKTAQMETNQAEWDTRYLTPWTGGPPQWTDHYEPPYIPGDELPWCCLYPTAPIDDHIKTINEQIITDQQTTSYPATKTYEAHPNSPLWAEPPAPKEVNQDTQNEEPEPQQIADQENRETGHNENDVEAAQILQSLWDIVRGDTEGQTDVE